MKTIGSWRFVKKVIPVKDRTDPKNQLPIFNISPFAIWGEETALVEGPECINILKANHTHCETVLVTGDGNTLQSDVQQFESLGIEHDLFCINRSISYFQRPVNHWAAIDAEESIWFAQNFNGRIKPAKGRLLRHTIGFCPIGYDVFWKVDQKFDNEYQKNIWAGNSGYFGILAAMRMGYRHIVLAGMPLNTEPHWYEPQDETGPNWVGQTYRTWMDCKELHPDSYKVRSMSGYSKFIFGSVTGEWLK